MQIELQTVLKEAVSAFSVSLLELMPPYGIEPLELNVPALQKEAENSLQRLLHRAAVETGYAELMMFRGRLGACFAAFRHPERSEKLILIGPWRDGGFSSERREGFRASFGEVGAAALEEWFRTIPQPPVPAFETVLSRLISLWFPEDRLTLRHLSADEGPREEQDVFTDSLFWQRYTEGYLEQRYEAENQLLNAVAGGNEQDALEAFRYFRTFDLGSRFTGSAERLQHGLVILNTLFRKSVERAGVHPYYLDEISSGFAVRLHEVQTAEEKQRREREMLAEYTRYVREYALKNYSTPVKKSIQYINRNLDQDLSLMNLARISSISQSYLSNLFRKETGTTLTEYISQQRVYRAAQLLRETDNSIASVAEAVGILDENYFTKMFRKYAGMPPSRYRLRSRGGE